MGRGKKRAPKAAADASGSEEEAAATAAAPTRTRAQKRKKNDSKEADAAGSPPASSAKRKKAASPAASQPATAGASSSSSEPPESAYSGPDYITNLPRELLQRVFAFCGVDVCWDVGKLSLVCRAFKDAVEEMVWPSFAIRVPANLECKIPKDLAAKVQANVKLWVQRFKTGRFRMGGFDFFCPGRIQSPEIETLADIRASAVLPQAFWATRTPLFSALASCGPTLTSISIFHVAPGAPRACHKYLVSLLEGLASLGPSLEALRVGFDHVDREKMLLDFGARDASSLQDALRPFTALRFLALQPGFAVGPAFLRAAGASIPALAVLSVESAGAEPATFETLAAAFPRLEELEFTDGRGTLSRPALKALGSLTSLDNLVLRAYTIAADAAEGLVEGGAPSLNGFSCECAEDTGKLLTALARLPALDAVDMFEQDEQTMSGWRRREQERRSYCELSTPSAWAALGRLTRLTGIGFCISGAACAEAGSSLRRLQNLTRIRFDFTQTHSEGTPALLRACASALPTLPKLESCRVTVGTVNPYAPNEAPGTSTACAALVSALGPRLHVYKHLGMVPCVEEMAAIGSCTQLVSVELCTQTRMVAFPAATFAPLAQFRPPPGSLHRPSLVCCARRDQEALMRPSLPQWAVRVHAPWGGPLPFIFGLHGNGHFVIQLQVPADHVHAPEPAPAEQPDAAPQQPDP